MSRKTKRRLRSTFIRLTALVMTFLSVFLSSAPIFANQIYPPAENLYDGGIYMIQNYSSAKYLTVPGYFDVNAEDPNDRGNNVYQSSMKVNSQYSYAVIISRVEATGKYVIEPLIFNHFGGGHIAYSIDGNVFFSQTETDNTEWIIEYNSSYSAYTFTADDGKRLTAVGNATGSVTEVNKNFPGNIIVSNGVSLIEQLWVLTLTDINPHIFKSDESVTKKNLGTGAEWIFQLSNSEIRRLDGTENTDVYVDTRFTRIYNSDIIDVATSEDSKYFIVRMKTEKPPLIRSADNYAIIQITVNNIRTTTRTVVIQDAGTGNNDACQTLPIYTYNRMNTVTVEEPTGELDSTYILTFSGVSPDIRYWSVGDDYVFDIVELNGISLKGNNFAIIQAKNAGYTHIRATDKNGVTYRKMIEVNIQTSDGIQSAVNVIDVFDLANQFNNTLELDYNSTYLLKTGNKLIMDEYWIEYYQTNSEITEKGVNYAILNTYPVEDDGTYPSSKLVNDSLYYYDEIRFNISSEQYTVNLKFEKNSGLCITNGIYYFEKYKDANENANEKNSFANKNGDLVPVFGGVDESSYWKLIYNENYEGYVIISDIDNDKILQLSNDGIINVNSEIELGYYNSNNITANQVWYIIFDGEKYRLKNCATTWNQNLYLSISNNFEEIILRENGETDWRIKSTFKFTNWEYICDECLGNSVTVCNHKTIAYWDNDPTVGIQIKRDKVDVSYNEDDVEVILNQCIEYYNSELGISVEYTDSFESADIKIYVTTKADYSDEVNREGTIPEVRIGETSFIDDKVSEMPFVSESGNESVKVHRIDKAFIGVFVYNNTPDLNWVIRHELGHALGLIGHTTDPSHVMYNICSGSNRQITTLTNSEIGNLKLLYEVVR